MFHTADRFSKLADTNLPGVTAVQWFPQAADEPPSHAEAIASELLAGCRSTTPMPASLHCASACSTGTGPMTRVSFPVLRHRSASRMS